MMARSIIKLNGYYFEFSSIVDSPVTFGMTLDEFKQYYRDEYGANGIRDLEGRLKRVEAKGTSSYLDESAESQLSFNRAGPDEAQLTVDEIFDAYCLRKPIRGGWIPKEAEEQ